MKELNIKEMITVQNSVMQNQKLFLTLRLPAGNEGSLNPTAVTDAFQKYADKPILVELTCRTKIFSENYQDFF